MTFILDVEELRKDLMEFSGQSYRSQVAGIKQYARFKYGVDICDGVFDISKIGFGGKKEQIYDSPVLLTRAVNVILKKQVRDNSQGSVIEIKHPMALYSLLTGMMGKTDIDIFGDVGDSFAFHTNIDGTVRVYGSVENYGGMHSFKGRHVYYDLSTELVGLANYGVHYLLLQGATERLNAMGRFGSVVTFGMGPDAGLYMAGGLLLDLNIVDAAEKVAPGIVGAKVIAMDGARPAKGAKMEKLDERDYADIAEVLFRHVNTPDLIVKGLDVFSPSSPLLYVARNVLQAPSDGITVETKLEELVEIDFRHFAKIVSVIPSVDPVAPVEPKINRNVYGPEDIDRLKAAHQKV
jgi:hypothetical protein